MIIELTHQFDIDKQDDAPILNIKFIFYFFILGTMLYYQVAQVEIVFFLGYGTIPKWKKKMKKYRMYLSVAEVGENRNSAPIKV